MCALPLPHSITNVIDDDLLNKLQEDATSKQFTLTNANKIEQCLASIVNIGLSCSVDSPQRTNIANVVHELQHILGKLQNI